MGRNEEAKRADLAASHGLKGSRAFDRSGEVLGVFLKEGHELPAYVGGRLGEEKTKQGEAW